MIHNSETVILEYFGILEDKKHIVRRKVTGSQSAVDYHCSHCSGRLKEQSLFVNTCKLLL